MENERMAELVGKFQRGEAGPADVAQLEQYIEAGTLALEDIGDLSLLQQQLGKMETPAPSAQLNDRFYAMLHRQRRKESFFPALKDLFTGPQPAVRIAAATVLLLAGVGIGRYSSSGAKEDKVEVLSQQITDLKEMMMLSLLEKDAATERLRAVNLTQEMTGASAQVTRALLKTLNHDENINVRLAALEALKPYVHDGFVRQELVRAIGRQDSPLVQVSLAELMAAIQERSSVKPLQKILRDTHTPEEVKKKIEESIEVMS